MPATVYERRRSDLQRLRLRCRRRRVRALLPCRRARVRDGLRLRSDHVRAATLAVSRRARTDSARPRLGRRITDNKVLPVLGLAGRLDEAFHVGACLLLGHAVAVLLLTRTVQVTGNLAAGWRHRRGGRIGWGTLIGRRDRSLRPTTTHQKNDDAKRLHARQAIGGGVDKPAGVPSNAPSQTRYVCHTSPTSPTSQTRFISAYDRAA